MSALYPNDARLQGGSRADLDEPDQYLFLLNPAYCGSTAFALFLLSSPQTVALNDWAEGQWIESVRDFLVADRWNPDLAVPWQDVKERWLACWRERKPARPSGTVLIEKSPPHLMRAKQIETAFERARFVVWMRDPWAWCASAGKRALLPGNVLSARDYRGVAEFWVSRARRQRWNLENLGDVICLTYEEFVTEPLQVKRRIEAFCPSIGGLDVEVQLKIKDHPISGIKDHNARQLSLLGREDRGQIREVLKREEQLVSFFGYSTVDLF